MAGKGSNRHLSPLHLGQDMPCLRAEISRKSKSSRGSLISWVKEMAGTSFLRTSGLCLTLESR